MSRHRARERYFMNNRSPTALPKPAESRVGADTPKTAPDSTEEPGK